MTNGVLFLVVGPSGVGKDTLIDAAREQLGRDPRFLFVRRVVTRAREAGGEDHEPMTDAEFDQACADEVFAVTWGAHGLRYGIRDTALAPLAAGQNVILNASRGTLAAFASIARKLVVLSITAPAEVVRQRLEARGREDAADVAARLARQMPLRGAGRVATIDNGGDIESGTRRFLEALYGWARLPLTLQHSSIDSAGEDLCLVARDAAPVVGQQVAGGGLVEVYAAGRAVHARLAFADTGTLPATSLALSSTPFARLGLPVGAEVEIVRVGPPVGENELTPRERTDVR